MQHRTLTSFIAIAICAITLAVPIASPSQASALSGGDFSAGHIMDNSVFFDPNGLSLSMIQSFLNAKVPTCDTWGTQAYSGTTAAKYGTSKGYPPPYTCLKDFRQDTLSKSAEPFLCNGYGQYNQSAAEIIYGVAQSCGVNPRVLLVLLQKEQGLVTDDWPWFVQYRSATGYGCPDTAPCDSEYYGFFNQVYQAARQFKKYSRDADQYNYLPNRNNFIQYNPSGSCGGSSIFLQNQATAGLYNYTPYQPNQAALNNLYGTGDSCSAYGNRNFWRTYNDWFGTTWAASYSAGYHSMSGYPEVTIGDTTTGWIRYTNTGNQPWYDSTSAPPGISPVNLAATNPINRSSTFYDSTRWSSSNRLATSFASVYEYDGTTLASNQHVVLPRQIVKFNLSFKAPNNAAAGIYREWIQPVLEGAPQWDIGAAGYIDVTVRSTYKASFQSLSNYPSSQAGQTAASWIKYKNTGNQPWYDIQSRPLGSSYVTLATSNPVSRVSQFGANWPAGNRPATSFAAVYEADGTTLASNQHVAQPGQVVRFDVVFTIPNGTAPGLYDEGIRPVLEDNINWDLGADGFIRLGVLPTTYSTRFSGLEGYPSGAPGTINSKWIQYKNTGNTVWYDSTSAPTGIAPVVLATDAPYNRSSSFSSSWPSPGRLSTVFAAVYEADGTTLASNQHVAQPGQVVRFTTSWTLRTNQKPGIYREWFRPSVDNAAATMTGDGGFFDVNVWPDSRSAAFHSLSGYPTVAAGQTTTSWIKYKNTGNQPWYDLTTTPAGISPLTLAMTSPINRPSTFFDSSSWSNNNRPTKSFAAVYEADGTTLASNQHVAQPGQVVRFDVVFKSPATPGVYREWMQPVFEGAIQWGIGANGFLDVTVP